MVEKFHLKLKFSFISLMAAFNNRLVTLRKLDIDRGGIFSTIKKSPTRLFHETFNCYSLLVSCEINTLETEVATIQAIVSNFAVLLTRYYIWAREQDRNSIHQNYIFRLATIIESCAIAVSDYSYPVKRSEIVLSFCYRQNVPQSCFGWNSTIQVGGAVAPDTRQMDP